MVLNKEVVTNIGVLSPLELNTLTLWYLSPGSMRKLLQELSKGSILILYYLLPEVYRYLFGKYPHECYFG
jgi:hypothetical protein